MSDYKIEIEIFEGKGGTLQKIGDEYIPADVKNGVCAWMYYGDGERSYQPGEVFALPEDQEKLCPYLLDSLSGIVKELEGGQILGWIYEGTPYEKVIDPDGVTTEYVRCVDPTASGIVVKVIRTKVGE